MKNLKKIGVLAIAIVMMFSFLACSSKTTVEEYVEENGSALEEQIEAGAEGVDCEVSAEGNSIKVVMKSDQFDGLSDADKKVLEGAFEAAKDQYKDMLIDELGNVEGLESIIYQICDSKGNTVVNFEFDME